MYWIMITNKRLSVMFQVVIVLFTVELSLFILSSISIGIWKASSCDHIIVGIGSCVIVLLSFTKLNFVVSTENVMLVDVRLLYGFNYFNQHL